MTTLAQSLDRARRASRRSAIVGFAAAVAAASQIAIPLPWTPVPITLQPMLVILAGMWLGPVAGAASMVLYLAAGAAGLPVFTPIGAPGIARFFGPTGGYLIAYPVAAYVAGVARAARDVVRRSLARGRRRHRGDLPRRHRAAVADLGQRRARRAARRDAVRRARRREGVRRRGDHRSASRHAATLERPRDSSSRKTARLRALWRIVCFSVRRRSRRCSSPTRSSAR